ncbi:MAG: hypothetical protein HY923_06255 [Elusimicrobia bacterium]|nr:hypothetical protein [Elusimicrobiota bacterium]
MADPTDFETQAKDAVMACIKADPLGGAAKIVPVIGMQLAHAARVTKEPKDAVVAACRGGFNAVLLGGQSVPDAAVGVMEALSGMSLSMRTSPEDLMSWVMEGAADVMPMAGAAVQDALRTRIEEKYMGASTIFDQFCEAAKNRG